MNSLEGLEVLVVDDDTDARELTAMILASAGAMVEEACSAEEALTSLQTRAFDVIVCDIGMPRMDGITMLRTLRGSQSPSCGARAMAFSAFMTASDQNEALAAGFDRHLGKTADAHDIVAAVSELGRPLAGAL